MKIQHRSDGSLVVHESFVFLHTVSVALFCLLPGLVSWLAHENVLMEIKGIGWVTMIVSLFCLVGMILDNRRFIFISLMPGHWPHE
jgi:hypothetical protein